MAYINKYLFSHDALLMKRRDWEQLRSNPGRVFEFDIYQTPMCNILISTFVIGAIAERYFLDQYKIKIYRIDPQDDPPYNVDTYILYEDFSNRPDFDDLVKHASTSADDNMWLFHNDNVIMEKAPPEDDHHSSYEQLPEEIQIKIYPRLFSQAFRLNETENRKIDKSVFIDPEANLGKIEDKILFYPFSGRDYHDPIALFRDYVSEFWFVDISYNLSSDGCRGIYQDRFRDMKLLDQELVGPQDITQTEIISSVQSIVPGYLKQKYIYMDKIITVIFRRDVDYHTLFGPSQYEIARDRLGIFFFRGTSDEGGSDHCWVYSKKQNILDIEQPVWLVKKLVDALPDGGLIVTDGSNGGIGNWVDPSNEYYPFCRFLSSRTSSTVTCDQAKRLSKRFTDNSGNKFTCIGHVGMRNGPTLIWQISKKN